MPQFDSGAAEQIGRFSEGLLLLALDEIARLLVIIATPQPGNATPAGGDVTRPGPAGTRAPEPDVLRIPAEKLV
jgi:hypothetical protein